MNTHKSSPSMRRNHLSRLPVRSQTTIGADGERETEHRVYCEVREATVDVDICANCARAREVPTELLARRPADPKAHVACVTGKAPLHELLDVSARAHALPLAQFMRRTSVSVAADANLETVERVVLEGDNDAVVVVGADHAPIGIITKTDLLWRLYDERDTSEPDPPAPPERGMHVAPPTVTASDVMTPLVHALPDDATLSVGVGLLALGGMGQVPVVSRSNEVVGILSNADIVRWLAGELGVAAAPSLARR
ncbi:MAG: CBS domain-containing protein [Polyangiaceae bacterium]